MYNAISRTTSFNLKCINDIIQVPINNKNVYNYRNGQKCQQKENYIIGRP